MTSILVEGWRRENQPDSKRKGRKRENARLRHGKRKQEWQKKLKAEKKKRHLQLFMTKGLYFCSSFFFFFSFSLSVAPFFFFSYIT